MGKIIKHPPVKLITGFIFKEKAGFENAKAFLKRRFGDIDFESQVIPFIHTGYYESEFGRDLKRSFTSFKKLITLDSLPKIKLATNRIEGRLVYGKSRLVNIDPGYLDLSQLVLASTKDYSHRIYLSCGIYAEVTLVFRGKTFIGWPWTYPDYKTQEYIDIFNAIRGIYAEQIKEIAKGK